MQNQTLKELKEKGERKQGWGSKCVEDLRHWRDRAFVFLSLSDIIPGQPLATLVCKQLWLSEPESRSAAMTSWRGKFCRCVYLRHLSVSTRSVAFSYIPSSPLSTPAHVNPPVRCAPHTHTHPKTNTASLLSFISPQCDIPHELLKQPSTAG